MKNNKKKPKKSCFLILFEAIILSTITTTLCFMAYTPGKKVRYSARQKACFSNIRVITGAVEMYNMDNDIKIQELNDSAIEILVKNNYLKSKPEPPEINKCIYTSEGDLVMDGFVYCKYHGDLEFKKECEFNEFYKEDRRRSKYMTLLVISICLGPALLFILVNLM